MLRCRVLPPVRRRFYLMPKPAQQVDFFLYQIQQEESHLPSPVRFHGLQKSCLDLRLNGIE